MLNHGPVQTDFDFDSPGKRSGFLDLPHSDVVHAFSLIQSPVGVIKGGDGPTVLLSAGNHGDEYEGQVILHQLMQQLEPEDVPGRIIFLPALNTPAVRARSRVSPLDNANMNRSFPGDPAHGPTGAIAAFVTAHLIPRADAILDFHSGGTATQYVDCGFLCLGENSRLNARNLALAGVFGAPFTMVTSIDGRGGDFDTTAHNLETMFLSCELGGLGRFSPQSFQTGWDGTRRFLTHNAVIKAGVVPPQTLPQTRFLDIETERSFATAAHHGLAQLHVSPGQVVHQGDPLATLFDLHNFGRVIARFNARQDGIAAICRRNPVVEPGDHLCLVAKEIPRPQP